MASQTARIGRGTLEVGEESIPVGSHFLRGEIGTEKVVGNREGSEAGCSAMPGPWGVQGSVQVCQL